MKQLANLFRGSIVLALGGILLSADLPNRTDPTPPTQPPRPDILLLPRPSDAVLLALADVKAIPIPERCYQRFVWIPNGDLPAFRITSLALNYISRGSVIRQPIPLANSHLARIDLRWYAPRDADLQEWIKLWDEFAFDPMFNLLITKDSADFAFRLAEVTHEVVVEPARKTPVRTESRVVVHPGGEYVYPDDSGRRHADLAAGTYTVDLEFGGQDIPAVRKRVSPSVDALRCNAPHLPQSEMCELQQMTHSLAPLVEHRYFMTRSLSTIQDKGVFKQVFGGLYYQFRGIKKSTVKGASDLDLFFETLGIGNIRAGLKQEQLFDSLRSDQRVAVFRSDITGKPREVSSFHTPADREGGSWGAITGDIKDGDVDIGDRAFANLLSPRRQAREAIFPTRTGLSVFALFDAAGELQDEVPPDVAVDATIPAPYTRRLQPAIGCIRCHGTDGSDGWKPLQNDVLRLIRGRLDIFGDLSQGRKTFDPDTIDRLAGLYTGDFSKNLRRARDDVAESTLKATGSFNLAENQADIGKVAAQAMADQYSDYNYTLIDARKALKEMGLDVAQAKAVDVFNRLMAMPMKDPNGVYLEKPTIGAIGAGISVLRADWALVFAEAQGRMQINFKKETLR